jgi:hypothetical protein
MAGPQPARLTRLFRLGGAPVSDDNRSVHFLKANSLQQISSLHNNLARDNASSS